MKVNGIPTRTIRALDNGSAIEIIDQTLLPYRFEKRILSDWRDGVEAIETMRVRGAPLIGIAGAWSVVLAVKEKTRLETPGRDVGVLPVPAQGKSAVRGTQPAAAAHLHVHLRAGRFPNGNWPGALRPATP